MFELVFLTGARAGEVVPVAKSLIAGRSPDCSLEVPDPNTSRQHSRFTYDGTALTVSDNGSSNGTYVNDLRLTTAHKLNHGDVVRLGETRIRFQLSRNRTGDNPNSSSIFGFKEEEGEAEADLSQSILLSVAEMPRKVNSPEVLAARLAAIIKVSKALVNINQIEVVYNGILETLFEVFPQADRGFLMIGKEVGSLEPKAIRQRGKGVTDNLHVSNTICRKALSAKAAILYDDEKSQDFDQGQSILRLDIRSAMTVPLMVSDEVLGLLQIDTSDSKRAFVAEDLELAVAVSQQAAIAMHNAQLLKKVEEEATTRNNLMRFLPGPVVDQALSGKINIELGGSSYRGTLMFSDVIGFTHMSENLHPEQVVKLMNSYFSRMVPCIEQHDGFVDKFLGDAIMAFWGFPIDKGGSALSGVQAALAMQNALVGFNSLQGAENGPVLNMGIGLNSGMVVAGNIGFDKRIEYTVLGDTVNTAQRLEAAAGRSQVLISNATWGELGGNGFGVVMPPLKVKNKAEPIATYSMRGVKVINSELLLHLPLRSAAHAVYAVRRLVDRTFIVLHPQDCDLCAAPLITAIPEWPDIELGVPAMEAVLPNQAADGNYIRSQIRLSDETLHGLLGAEQVKSTLGWDAMARS